MKDFASVVARASPLGNVVPHSLPELCHVTGIGSLTSCASPDFLFCAIARLIALVFTSCHFHFPFFGCGCFRLVGRWGYSAVAKLEAFGAGAFDVPHFKVCFIFAAVMKTFVSATTPSLAWLGRSPAPPDPLSQGHVSSCAGSA
jgi:hypothetical protein